MIYTRNLSQIKKKLLILLLSLTCTSMYAQIKLHADTLQCPIVGFHAGITGPWGGLSRATSPDGQEVSRATMADLYKGPWLDFGIDLTYKWKSGLFVNVEGNLIFRDDNLKERELRMSDIYTTSGLVIGANGTDAAVVSHNRMLSAKVGAGKIFTLNAKNPNTGPYLQCDAGMMQQQTVFVLSQNIDAPQVNGDYANLYDHQRRGFLLAQTIGFWYHSNNATLLNFHVGFELVECWSRSTRDYVIDDYMGLRGKDDNRYFDMLYSLKLTWMFPITGKPKYDYYYH